VTYALIETDGTGVPTGVWLAGADNGDPDVAFTDEVAQLMAERTLGEAKEAMGATLDWPAFLASLFDRQNHLTRERVQIDWPGTATELLAAALDAHREGLPLLDVRPPART